MGLKELLDALASFGLSVHVNIEGKEAVAVTVAEKKVNIDIKDAAAIGKILQNLK